MYLCIKLNYKNTRKFINFLKTNVVTLKTYKHKSRLSLLIPKYNQIHLIFNVDFLKNVPRVTSSLVK